MLFESMLAIGALLLIGSGGMKLVDRSPTRGALKAARLPSSEQMVVGLAVSEIAVGLAVIVIDHPVAALAFAALYAGFTGFVAYALANRLPVRSCGCFGRADTPPSAVHLVVNGVFAVAGAFVAGSTSLAARLDAASLWGGIGLLGMAGIGAFLVYLLLAEFPATMAAVRGGG